MNERSDPAAETVVKPTPGPWTLGVWGRHIFVAGGPNNDDIAEFNHSGEHTVKISREEAIANGALFFAAPDMLAALLDARKHVQSRLNGILLLQRALTADDIAKDVEEASQCLARIDAAIAKATGREIKVEEVKMTHYIMVIRHTKYWIVGPFDTWKALLAWGRDPANNPTDDLRWQSIELMESEVDCAPVVMKPEFATEQVKLGTWV